jgi:hypothetical protein
MFSFRREWTDVVYSILNHPLTSNDIESEGNLKIVSVSKTLCDKTIQ